MQSLLQDLPIEAASKSYSAPSQASQMASSAEGLSQLYKNIFGT
jgi:hypothetical protein